MNIGKRILVSLLAGVCLWTAATDVQADPPMFKNIFKRKANSANALDSSMTLQPEHGPWLIIAHTMQGDDAESKAMALANELRSSYGLRAYIMPKKFDFTEVVPGAGFDQDGDQKRMKYAKSMAFDCYSVLVGDFQSAESPNYEETLKIIKCARPKTLGLDGSNPGAQVRGGWTDIRKFVYGKEGQSPVKPGPMLRAFGTPNPLLPKDFFQPPTVDKFVKQLNDQVEHSLLENPARFTVRIATFRGDNSVVPPGKQISTEVDQESDALDRAAKLANIATMLLRSQGIEAYQFHDRVSSIVTIGGFDSIGGNNAEGVFAYDPRIQEVLRTFGGVRDVKGSQYGAVPVARTLLDVVNYRKIPELNTGTEKEKMKWVKKYSIPLDMTPSVMAIPKPETKSIYGGSLLGQR